jgi:cytochrome c553
MFQVRFLGACLLAAALQWVSGNAQAQSAARPHVRLPSGAVRSVILNHCVSCHGIDDYAFHALDRAGWQQILDVPHKQQRGVKLATADEVLLLDYLTETFGPESVPFPRNYIARGISEFFNNADARVFLQKACTECHEVRVFQHRKDANGWRALVLDMRERGAKLSDQNVEKLVEWLARVRGINPVD